MSPKFSCKSNNPPQNCSNIYALFSTLEKTQSFVSGLKMDVLMEALRIGSQKVQKTIQQRPSTAGRLVKMRMKTKSGAATVCSTACKPISFCWYGHPIAHPLGSVPLFRVIETNDWPASAREGFFRQIKHLRKRTCPPQGDPHAPHDDSGWDSDGGRGGGRLAGLQGASLDSPTASAGREWEPGRATPKARPTHPPPPCLRSRDAQPERALCGAWTNCMGHSPLPYDTVRCHDGLPVARTGRSLCFRAPASPPPSLPGPVRE